MRAPRLSPLLLLPLLAACASPPTAESCKTVCDAAVEAARAAQPAPAGGLALTAFQAQVIAPVLEDVKGGVREFEPGGVAICKGNGKDCEASLGLDAGLLPPGDHMIRADLRVPNVGPRGTWKVVLTLDCKTTYTAENGDVRESQSTRSREFDVSYAGDSRGYRLSPMHKIESPDESGAQDCTFTLTAPHGDGDKVWKGSWSVAQR